MVKSVKKAFTLAEVLTTLMVIGVVAAMTIPTLLNSTNDQQLRVAYKKGMSILSQGIQLMVAQEDECYVKDNYTLANCMQKVIAGTLYKIDSKDKLELPGDGDVENFDNNNADAGQYVKGNVIVTNDGLSYAFYYKDSDATDDEKNVKRSLDDICGSSTDMFKSEEDYWNGTESKCIVIVDMNGPSKGTHGFVKDGEAADVAETNLGAADDAVTGSDQMPLLMSGGGVRPLYAKLADNAEDDAKEENKIFNKGYKWVYGENAGVPFN